MKNIFIISVAILTSLLFASCTEVLDVDLDTENDRLVVDGLVTNQLKPFQVKLSRTLALDDSTAFPAVNNAFVTIGDNQGNLDTLYLETNGVYKTNGPRQGVVGRTYLLTISVDGKSYVGQDILTSVAPIDTIFTLYREKGEEAGIQEAGYYIYFAFMDPAEKNYYMEEITKDLAPVLKSNQLAVYNDQFIKPNVVFLTRAPGRFVSGEKAVLTLSSLSEAGYNYMNGVALQLQNDGGFFSTPPANAPTNLSAGALGFFKASSVAVDSLIVP